MSRVFVFFCALLFVGSTAATDWPRDRFDDNRSGYNSGETTIGPSNVGALQVAWSQDLGTGSVSQAAVANGVVYVVKQNGPLEAYSASGCGSVTCSTRLWQTPPGLHFSNGMAVADGVIYATAWRTTTGPTILYAFAAGGCGASVCAPLWLATVGQDVVLTGVSVANGRVYAGGGSGNLYVFNAAGCASGTCRPLWVGQTATSNLNPSPTVVDGKVYVETTGGGVPLLYVFNAAGCASGACKPLWVVSSFNSPTPPVVDGMLFLQASKSLGAFDANGCGASKCGPLWETGSDPGYAGGQAVAEGIVYVRYSNVGIRAFAAAGCGQATCPQLWTLDSHGVALNSAITVANGLVYGVVGVGASAKVLAWPAQPCGQDLCQPVWTSREGEFVVGEPVIVDGRLYAFSVSGSQYSMDVYTLP